jgi:hypothetical protein
VPPLYELDSRVVNGGTVMTRDIKSVGLAPCFALASLQNSPRIQLVGNDFFVQESIGSIEPTVFTSFFLVFITGLLLLENFCTNF